MLVKRNSMFNDLFQCDGQHLTEKPMTYLIATLRLCLHYVKPFGRKKINHAIPVAMLPCCLINFEARIQ